MADTQAASLSYTKQGTVAWVQLCRPETGNCLTPNMDEELAAFCASAEEDETVSLIVLTGSADVFCRGLEYVTEGETSATQVIREQFGTLHSPQALAAVTKPT